MKNWDAYSDGDITNVLNCFLDINHFARSTQAMPLRKVAELLKNVAGTIDQYVSNADGKIIKYIGDAALMIFHEDTIDRCIEQMLHLKEKLEELLCPYDTAMTVTFSLVHGEIIFGQLKPFKTLDIFGDAVNQAALLTNPANRGKFVISEAAMQRANEKTRALFHERRPPAIHIAN